MIKQEIFNDLTTVLGNKIIKKEDGFYFDDTKIIFPKELPLLDIASDKDKYIYCDTEDGCEFLLKKLDYGYDGLVEDSKISISFSELSDGLACPTEIVRKVRDYTHCVFFIITVGNKPFTFRNHVR